MQEVLFFIEIFDIDFYNIDSFYDQFDFIRWISYSFDQRNVILFQCVQGSYGSIQGWYGNCQFGFIFILSILNMFVKLIYDNNLSYF